MKNNFFFLNKMLLESASGQNAANDWTKIKRVCFCIKHVLPKKKVRVKKELVDSNILQ